MTFTIMGFCDEPRQVGIGLATVSLAAGGIAPFVTTDGDIVSSQAYAQPTVGLRAVQLLNDTASFAEMQQELEANDPFFRYRQVGVVKRSGDIFVYTGDNTRPWAGHVVGRDHLAMGNVLAGEHVVAAMAEAFEQSPSSLAGRLIAALEAGRNAGGQATGGVSLTERSAVLRVLGEGCYPEYDLRVDMHDRAVDELRRLFDIYTAYNTYNKLRANDPPNTPPIAAWEAQHLQDNPPPSPMR